MLLMMPQTFMNLSGEAVTEAMRFYKLPPEQVLIMLDDITLPVGALRLRRKGSDGGPAGHAQHHHPFGQRAVPPHQNRRGGRSLIPITTSADWVLSKFTGEDAVKMLRRRLPRRRRRLSHRPGSDGRSHEPLLTVTYSQAPSLYCGGAFRGFPFWFRPHRSRFFGASSLVLYRIICPGPLCLMVNDVRCPWA